MTTRIIENRGSLMTWAGTNQCLGYLVNFPGHGIYEPEAGRVDVTPEEANKHNQCLAEAEIKGLDDNCQVGQGCTFYFDATSPVGVTTWNGMVVAPKDDIYVDGSSIQFTRKGKTFRGREGKSVNCIFFKRIA